MTIIPVVLPAESPHLARSHSAIPTTGSYDPNPPLQESYENHKTKMPANPSDCKHPRVQLVSRDQDAEFVECLECGDIFDLEELKDLECEAKAPLEEEQEEGE